MASDPHLRRKSGTALGVLAPHAAILAVLLSLVAVLLVSSQLARLDGGKAASQHTTAFLTKALGSPQSSAPLVRKPSRSQTVRLNRNGFTYVHGTDAVSLATNGAGTARWTRYRNGVSRKTPFGSETITILPFATEQFLTVTRRQGHTTWTWRLGTTLNPTLNVDGGVDLGRGLHISPVRIVDASGKDVTPSGARWSLDHGLLELKLDDSHLPLPYVIDPAVTFRAIAGVTTANATTIALSKPLGTASGDVLVASLSTVNNYAVTSPGWTLLSQVPNGATSELISLYKVAGGAEPASYTFTVGTVAVKVAGAIEGFTSADNNAPIDDLKTATGSGTAMTATNAVPVQNSTDTVVAFAVGRGDTYSGQTGFTSQASGKTGNGGGNASLNMGDAGNNTSMTDTNSSSAVWEAQAIALSPTLEADGSGTLTVTAPTKLAASSTGNTVTFHYVAASVNTGGINKGGLKITIPAGWTAPQTTANVAGDTTSTTGTVSVSGQVITVSNLSLAAGGTVNVVYGDTTGGAGGASTIGATTGSQSFTCQSQAWTNAYAATNGTFTNLGACPSLTVYAPNGSGTAAATAKVSASATGQTITNTYTVATGGMSGGAVSMVVPTGWTAPQSTTANAAGYVTAGHVPHGVSNPRN